MVALYFSFVNSYYDKERNMPKRAPAYSNQLAGEATKITLDRTNRRGDNIRCWQLIKPNSVCG